MAWEGVHVMATAHPNVCMVITISENHSLLHTLHGIILTVVFIRMKKDKGKDNVESTQASEVKPLRS
ncbi:hypothetical protein P7K49_026932 [Saguinus oedipus]|uniref:Uncharacterized protein n=1 Tax=Saguinus oedipus TaxID=9490 RepID=A0ABQ9UEN8_SAGOE|nr:hypothetical protein P7K49_026932 [Saguinus oedipus]